MNNNIDSLNQSQPITASTSPITVSTAPLDTALTTDNKYYKSNGSSWTFLSDVTDTYITQKYPEHNYINLLIVLPEEKLIDILSFIESRISKTQRKDFSQLIKELITNRKFSEDFLLQFCEYLEDINDLLVIHRYEILNDEYKTLRFHLLSNYIL